MKPMTIAMILANALPMKPSTPNKIARPPTMRRSNPPVAKAGIRFSKAMPNSAPAPAPSSHMRLPYSQTAMPNPSNIKPVTSNMKCLLRMK